jgi:hypothetical protein
MAGTDPIRIKAKIIKGVIAMRYTLYVLFASCLLVYTPACNNLNSRIALERRIKTLGDEKTILEDQIAREKAENKRLRGQIKTLAGIEEKIDIEKILDLQEIRLGRYTNLYDKDKDGQYETLIVYLQTVDRSGDVVKTAGAVDVELWDLNKPDGRLIGKWLVTVEELNKLWFATIITINYRLTFDIAGSIEDKPNELIVKARFTDYLSGKVFKEQKIIKPRWE